MFAVFYKTFKSSQQQIFGNLLCRDKALKIQVVRVKD